MDEESIMRQALLKSSEIIPNARDAELSRLRAANERLRKAGRELCRLKALKDSLGKTAEYLRDQPLAWEAMRQALAEQETEE